MVPIVAFSHDSLLSMNVHKRTLVTLKLEEEVRAGISAHLEDMAHLEDTVVHVWKDKSTLNNVLQAGYKAIISDQADWYLDHEDVTWEQMYRNEPTQGLSPGIDVDALLIGGEACMWDERVDPSVVFNTVWPRAAAVAER